MEVIYSEFDYINLNENYYLIIYRNKALTNVPFTYNINTIEDIKEYINNKQSDKELKIINGKIETTSEILDESGLDYINHVRIDYYKTDSNGVPRYATATLKDFEIYTSYQEKYNENAVDYKLVKMVSIIKPINNYIYIIIPISSILLIAIVIYLINAIGYTKGKDGIELNDFDKIPIEVILSVVIVAILVLGIVFIEIGSINEEQINLIISVMITIYLVGYYICAITINTIVKRIKAKTIVQTSWILRICKWVLSMIKKIFKKIEETRKIITYSSNTTFKVICYSGAIFLISLLIFAIFQETGIIIEFIFIGYILYRIIKEITCFSKIENKLKEMYEGNNKTKLNEKEFTPIFVNSVRYINDVSNGFENAIQEGMKSERLKTELITNVSHDIRTPLTSIVNYVDLLKQERIEDEKILEYINVLDKKSQRLKKLTDDLIEASKVTSGSVKLNIENINICELIKQSTGEFGDKFNNKGLSVISNIPNEEILIKADNRYMYRIIENLFSNISKYALEKSRVYIDVIKMSDKVKIEIKNISKEKLNITADELMQRFVRGDRSRTTEGSGLGISISKSLTELQNGKFDMQIDGDLFKVGLLFTYLH